MSNQNIAMTSTYTNNTSAEPSRLAKRRVLSSTNVTADPVMSPKFTNTRSMRADKYQTINRAIGTSMSDAKSPKEMLKEETLSEGDFIDSAVFLYN